MIIIIQISFIFRIQFSNKLQSNDNVLYPGCSQVSWSVEKIIVIIEIIIWWYQYQYIYKL